MILTERAKLSAAVHICMDIQDEALREFSRANRETLCSNILNTVVKLQYEEIPTIFVLFDTNLYSQAFGIHREIHDRLRQTHYMRGYDYPRPALPVSGDDLVAVKSTLSAYGNELLVAHIKAAGYRTIILSGIFEMGRQPLARSCLSLTAMDFSAAGLDVCIVAEATNNFVCGGQDGVKPVITIESRRALHAEMGVAVSKLDKIVDMTRSSSHRNVGALCQPAVKIEQPLPC